MYKCDSAEGSQVMLLLAAVECAGHHVQGVAHETWLAWQCAACRGKFVLHQLKVKFQAPTKCPQDCRNQRSFAPEVQQMQVHLR